MGAGNGIESYKLLFGLQDTGSDQDTGKYGCRAIGKKHPVVMFGYAAIGANGYDIILKRPTEKSLQC